MRTRVAGMMDQLWVWADIAMASLDPVMWMVDKTPRWVVLPPSLRCHQDVEPPWLAHLLCVTLEALEVV